MDRPIALAHGPEGAGNATRMLAIAEELGRVNVPSVIAGGGPGAGFLEMNGFEEYEPTTLDFIAKREAEDVTLLHSLAHAFPRVYRRFLDFLGWLRRENPRALLTDDPVAAIPAGLLGIPWYRLDHTTVSCYSRGFERFSFRLFNGLSLRASQGFFLTSVFEEHQQVAENFIPGEWTTENLIPVGPIAHEPASGESVDPFDVLLIPGTYSRGFDELADRLEEDGFSVKMVGGPNWEPVPAMFPYHEAAEMVVCTGFSSIAEAVVAGTACIVYPFIDCQQGIADQITDREVDGIEVVHSIASTLEAVYDPPTPTSFENGAPAVAEHIRSDLRS